MQYAFDKRLTYELAERLGLDHHPRIDRPRTREEVEKLQCEFPIVLKPAVKTSINRFTRARAWVVNNRAKLMQRHEEADKMVGADAALIQQMTPGGSETHFSYASLYNDGRLLASLVAHRARQYPVDFGQASFVETCECEDIERSAERILGAIRYTGK
jgi:D-aspartate ligase